MASKSDQKLDKRKWDVGDTLVYKFKGEELKHKVYAVRFQEDVDGHLHSYQYIMDTGLDETTQNGRQRIYNVIDSSFVIKKV